MNNGRTMKDTKNYQGFHLGSLDFQPISDSKFLFLRSYLELFTTEPNNGVLDSSEAL